MAYVYRHVRLDKNEVFYIGCSVGVDPNFNRARTKIKRTKAWYEVERSSDYRIDILFDGLTKDQAYEKESEFITLYGRMDIGTGTLVNKTNGGRGCAGMVHSPESIKKNSEAKIKNPTRYERTELIRSKHREFATKNNPSSGLFSDKAFNFKGNIEVFKDGVLIGTFAGLKETSENVPVSINKISNCVLGKKISCKGYVFKRINNKTKP